MKVVVNHQGRIRELTKAARCGLLPVSTTPSEVYGWNRRCVMERRQFMREFKLEAVQP